MNKILYKLSQPKIALSMLTLISVIVTGWLIIKVSADAYKIAADAALNQASTVWVQVVRTASEKMKPAGYGSQLEELIMELKRTLKDEIEKDPSIRSLVDYDVFLSHPKAGFIDFGGNFSNNEFVYTEASATRKDYMAGIFEDFFPDKRTEREYMFNSLGALHGTKWNVENTPKSFWTQLLVPEKMFSIKGFQYSTAIRGVLAISRTSNLIDKQSNEIIDLGQKYVVLYLMFIFGCLALSIMVMWRINRLSREKIEGDTAKKNLTLWEEFNHDIKEPLFNSKRAAKKLLTKDPSSKEVLAILKSNEQITESIDTLEVESISNQSESILIKINNVKTLILQCSRSYALKDKLLRKNCRLSVGEIESCSILGKETGIYRVLKNLLNNAIDFSPNGIVEIFAVSEGDWYTITVLDSGVGISEEVRQSFGTGKSFPREDGEPSKGKGLLIVKKIIEEHNGEFYWPENRPGCKGAQVVVKLPIAQSD